MRRLVLTALLIALVGLPRHAPGQGAPAIAAGAATGLAGGLVVTVGWVVEQAAFEDKYLHGMSDLVSFTGTPVVLGPAIGVSLALVDQDAMWRVTGGGAVGMLAGTALGIGLGHAIRGQRGRWAGGAMGAAVGLLVGASAMIVAERDTLLEADDPADRGIPVGVRLRF